MVHRLVRSGHRAADRAHERGPAGGRVNESLARAVGIVDPQVVEAAPGALPALDKLVVFVPHEARRRRPRCARRRGGEVLGDYDSCTFTSTGEGRFRPLDGATPTIGRVGEVEVVPERVETVFARHLRRDVVAAMKAAHPYEEVAYDVLELASVPGEQTPSRGHGRIGRGGPTTLRGFAERVAAACPDRARGRVAGDPDRPVETVVVGSGCRRLPARHGARHRRGRLPHLRPAAPPRR